MFNQSVVAGNVFLTDVLAVQAGVAKLLRTDTPAGAAETIGLLQSVLAAEIVCVMRYTMISVSEIGLRNSWIGAEFQEQANDERRHMQMVADRIKQLGGTPNFNPPHLQSRIAALKDGDNDFAKRVAENLAAEQAVIAHYKDLVSHFSKTDELSRAMLQHIIHDEEAHTSDMQDILDAYFG